MTTPSAEARAVPQTFQVAFSFAGEQHDIVCPIAEAVEAILGRSTVFFADWYVPYIAVPDADLLLQQIYSERATLVVVCISEEQSRKQWTQIEFDVIRERINRARTPEHAAERWNVLVLRVGDGKVRGISSNTIAPDVRGRSPEETARLVVDRLHLLTRPGAVAAPPPAFETPINVAPPDDPPTLDIAHIVDFDSSQTLIRNALALYEDRIPEGERYPHEFMVDLVRRHLSDEFAPSWTMHLLVALYGGRTVGMLICYEHLTRNLAFISYIAAYNPRLRGPNPVDVSAELARGLIETRKRLGLTAPRFLFEVDDPARATTPGERRKRLGRLELFERMAPYEKLHVRALDIGYLQPNLDGPGHGHERPLLLCYAAPRLGGTMPKNDVVDLLNWTYTELYGDDIFEDPTEREAYGRYTRALLARVVGPLADPVRLLKHQEAGARTSNSSVLGS